MTWHKAYREQVLAPDYRFAKAHLKAHFLHALTAHVRTVRRLESPAVQAQQGVIAELEDALIKLHGWSAPGYEGNVPDLYFAINRELESKLGVAAVSFLRLGLSRNDLDMTVYKMRARDLLLELAESALALQATLLTQAEDHIDTVLVAHTHHQPGQPTSLAHYLLAVNSGLSRNAERLLAAYERLNECPLGAAALAGSSHTLDRAFTAHALGFSRPVGNTYDAVASSDWQIDLVGVAQQYALTLSRFVCDLLGWASQGLYRLAGGLVQGSSIMPQKRNPVALEHARTRFSRALGASQMVVFSSHNIPFGDLNDFGPDIQGALQTLFLQLHGGLELLSASVATGAFDKAALTRLARESDTTATELADELARCHGLAFQDAHRLVAQLVTRLSEQGRLLLTTTSADLIALGGPALPQGEIDSALDPLGFIRRRSGIGGPAPKALEQQLSQAHGTLAQQTGALAEAKNLLQQVDAKLTTKEKIV